jgi:succinate dehydrogenase/fumarate reductase flavoprotein subunit
MQPVECMNFKPLQADQVSQWDGTADVLVVGFGGAGACAAIEAADSGASVIIFDAASGAGGSTALSSAELYLGGGTSVQRAVGYDDTVEAAFGYLMASNSPQADPEKVRAYAEGGADHLEWLKSLGVPFKHSEYPHRAMLALSDDCLLYTGSEKAWPYRDQFEPAPRGHNLEVEGDNGGPLLMQLLEAAVRERGVAVALESRALRLIVEGRDDALAVCGVVVRQDGEERYYRAERSVVLCAGGFVMNSDMLNKHAPKLQRATIPIGNPNDTGAGIQMAAALGARLINMDEGFVSLPFYPPASLTFGILVDGNGQRFINEDVYHGRVGTLILDQTWPVYLVVSVEDYADYETVSYLGAPIAATGETIEELCVELGLPEGALETTIETFNTSAAHGEDPQCHKHSDWLKPLTAPLVALDCTPGRGAFFPYFTLGGVDTTVNGAVLNEAGEPIPGLYAAGRTACGVPRRGDGYASGSSVGDATFSGRHAGRAAAQIGDTA